jgi:NTE family protein
MKKRALLILLTVLLCSYLSAEPFDYTSLNGDIYLTDVPEYFGEENFVEKVNHTESETLPLGLVFSGGAARAFAHIGVLQKLEEENIYPDFIVANSMGSVVALLYAAGVSPDMIQQLMLDYDTKDLFQLKLPLDGGVLDPARFISVLYDILGELDIKELKIPVAIISEDLVSRRQVVFMEGDFYKVLQGSISMPFSFPPVDYNGMMLIDGGVTNLVPVDVAAKYTDRIIVSTALYDREPSYSSFTAIINRAFDIGKTRKGVNQLKYYDPVLIRCDVENFSFMDFQRMDEIVEKGYESAAEVVLSLPVSFVEDLSKGSNRENIKYLNSKRNDVYSSYDRSRQKYSKTGVIPQKELSGSFSAGFRMYSGTADDYNLNNLNYLNLKQKVEYGYFEASVSEYWSGEDTGLDNHLNFVLFDFLRIKNRMLFNWDDWDYEYSYYYGRGDFNISPSMETSLLPFAAYESEFDTSYNVEKSIIKSGLDAYFSRGDYFVSGFWFDEGPGTAGIGGKNNVKIMFSDYFGLRQKSTVRFPFDSSDSLELYRNDGLRGSTATGEYGKIIVTNNNLSFFTDADLTLGEIIIIKDVEASAFCDYFQRDEAGISTGMSLDFDMSFIGLTSVIFSAYAGYDWHAEEIFGGITVSSGE